MHSWRALHLLLERTFRGWKDDVWCLRCCRQPLDHMHWAPEKPLSSRLMSTSVRLSQRCLILISAYAPPLMACSEDKDEFYQLLSESLSTIPKGGGLVLAGDFNARLGAEYDHRNGALVSHGVGKMNENGNDFLNSAPTTTLHLLTPCQWICWAIW